MEDALIALESHKYTLGLLVSFVFGAYRFYLETKDLKGRVIKLEKSLEENTKEDAKSEKDLSERMTGVENAIDKFEKALKAILKHLKIPDML